MYTYPSGGLVGLALRIHEVCCPIGLLQDLNLGDSPHFGDHRSCGPLSETVWGPGLSVEGSTSGERYHRDWMYMFFSIVFTCVLCSVFGVWCLVFGVWCLASGVWCLVFDVTCLVFGVLLFGLCCLVFGVTYSVFGVQDLGVGLRAYSLGVRVQG